MQETKQLHSLSGVKPLDAHLFEALLGAKRSSLSLKNGYLKKWSFIEKKEFSFGVGVRSTSGFAQRLYRILRDYTQSPLFYKGEDIVHMGAKAP